MHSLELPDAFLRRHSVRNMNRNVINVKVRKCLSVGDWLDYRTSIIKILSNIHKKDVYRLTRKNIYTVLFDVCVGACSLRKNYLEGHLGGSVGQASDS